MNHTLSLRSHFEDALASLSSQTGTAPDVILLAACEEKLSPLVDQAVAFKATARLAAFDGAAATATKAQILAAQPITKPVK